MRREDFSVDSLTGAVRGCVFFLVGLRVGRLALGVALQMAVYGGLGPVDQTEGHVMAWLRHLGFTFTFQIISLAQLPNFMLRDRCKISSLTLRARGERSSAPTSA